LNNWVEKIGANLTNQFDVRSTTHLVTPDRVSTAKTICAWASRTPIVTTDFVRALASFVTNDGQQTTIPKEESFQPTGNLPMDNIDPSLPRDCLKHYNVVILKDKNESEGMILAAGGSVLKIYEWTDVLIHLHSIHPRLLLDLPRVILYMCTLQSPEFVFVLFTLELNRFAVIHMNIYEQQIMKCTLWHHSPKKITKRQDCNNPNWRKTY